MRGPRSSSLDLTKEEQQHVRAALQFLRRRAGGWLPLAKVLGYQKTSLADIAKAKTVMPTLAFRVARLAQVSVDDLLAGKFPAPGTCPYCGHVKEDDGELTAPAFRE